jgi:predicted RNA-binding Zn-ribbon protein involved in translation (DUF1610 family)
MPDAHATRQANRLYWETESSVAEIADELDISRRMLYDLIEPRHTDASCPECGAGLVFRNRTALDRRQAECPECEVEVPLVEPHGVEPAVEQEHAAANLSPVARDGTVRGNAPLLSGALLLGLAAGAAAAHLVRNR